MSNRPIRTRFVVLVLVSLFAQSAYADERTEARRHFRRGMELLVEGQVDEGIGELELAYEILPHPNVLYNIGRAYAEAGRYEEAIDYFDRYLASSPADADEVRGYVAALHVRIENRAMMEQAAAAAAAAEAAEAESSTTSTTTATTTATGPGVRASASEIAELRSTADRLEALGRVLGGTELADRAAMLRNMATSMEAANEATTTATTTTTHEVTTESSTTTTESAAPPESGSIGLASADTDLYEERFVSSTRAALDPLDAPNSTTIITRQDIRLTGLTAIGELLRRVAGVQVMSTGPSETNVGMRGFNQRISPRVLLLINGRSTYVDILGITLWQLQPISVEDIERIEVVRGPASALYGANGFSGIVNVITRTPGDDPSTEFSLSAGSGDQVRGYIATSGRGGSDGRVGYRVSVAYDQMDRFTMPLDTNRIDAHSPSVATDPSLAQRSTRAYGNLTYRLGQTSEAYVEAGTTFINPALIGGTSVFNDLYMRGTTSFAMAGVTSGWGGVRFFWNAFDVDTDQLGLNAFELDTRSNTYDLEGTFAHEFDTGPLHHNVVAGAGYRRKFVDWSIIARDYTEDHFQGFAQDSIRIADRVTLVAGIRIDRHPLLERPVFSPRGALVGRVGERQSIRASVSTAFRTQNFMESYLYTFQPTPVHAVSAFGGGSDVNRSLFGTKPLRPERILSAEIGYQNNESDVFSIDAAAYFNRVEDLLDLSTDSQFFRLSDTLNPELAAVSGFNRESNTYVIGTSGFENVNGTYFVGGLELVGRLYPVDGLDIYANYSLNVTYLDRNGDLERKTRAPAHQLNTGVQYRGALGEHVGLDLAVDVHVQSSTRWDEQQLTEAALEVLPFDLSALYMINARTGLRFLDDRLSVGVVGYNINAFFGPNYRQHPFTQPVGGRVLGNIAYRF